MNLRDPLSADLQAMFAHDAGPPTPLVTPRRGRASRRLVLVVGLAVLLVGASIASARVLDLFDGQPASLQVKAEIAAGGLVAPAALDPKIEAGKTVVMITLPTSRGTVSLLVASAANAGYCMGLTLSWLHGAGLGCDGPGGRKLPIDVGQAIPGIVGRSPNYVYGHVRDARATHVRMELTDGSRIEVALTNGFFLTELGPAGRPDNVQALDEHGAILSEQAIESACPPASTGVTLPGCTP